MARSVIGVALGSTNGNAVVTSVGLTAGATGTAGYMSIGQSKDERFGLLITNTGSATGSVWIKASDAYIEKDQGDLAVVIGGSVTKLIGPLEGQRFTQSGATGAINIDSGITGTVMAVQI
jgi:hypothetical protein